MKNRFFLLLLLCMMPCVLAGQSSSDSSLIGKYYYTAKVWGYLKYFHSEVAKGMYNWDTTLIKTLGIVRRSTSNQEFNDALSALINSAGAMQVPAIPEVVVPDNVPNNLDLRWHADTVLSLAVRSALDTIRTRFRPQSNYYVGEVFTNGNPTFDSDTLFYSAEYRSSEDYWLLGLFRFWNVINYFAPYKYLIVSNWDDVLRSFIAKIMRGGEDNYQMTMWELMPRVNDTHAYAYSPWITESTGEYYLPFRLRLINGETVIYQVVAGTVGIKAGDVIRSLNGVDIRIVRDSLRRFASGSNVVASERIINSWLIRGAQNSIARLVIENPTGSSTVSFAHSLTSADFAAAMQPSTPAWRTIRSPDSLSLFGYVDLGRMAAADVSTMFSDFRTTDAMILDCRTYPLDAIVQVARYLFQSSVTIAMIYYPDVRYPGVFHSRPTYTGSNVVTVGSYKKEIRILINESTISAGEFNAMLLELHRPSLKFGSQTSGADGNVSYVYMPGSIFAGYSGTGVTYPDGRQTQRIGIVPDVEVHPTIEGVRQGRDEVLEAALQRKLLTSVSSETSSTNAEQFALAQNYPNPFNPSTTIRFQIPTPSRISLKIFNVLGEVVEVLADEEKEAGGYRVHWNGSTVPSGVYFYRLQSEGQVETRKMILLR